MSFRHLVIIKCVFPQISFLFLRNTGQVKTLFFTFFNGCYFFYRSLLSLAATKIQVRFLINNFYTIKLLQPRNCLFYFRLKLLISLFFSFLQFYFEDFPLNLFRNFLQNFSFLQFYFKDFPLNLF